jgi:hypothetical protein
MTQDLLNAMEELAKMSLFVRDLAEGITGEVLMDISDYDSPQELLNEIHEAQFDLAQRGWSRCKDSAVLMPYNQRNVECGAWFKNKPDGDGTDWIRCTITTRFGLRARFWNVIHLGEHQVKTGD